MTPKRGAAQGMTPNRSGMPGLSSKNPTQQTLATAEQEQPVLKEEVYDDVQTILTHTIDEIWEMFDDDGNGLFDSDETTSFIKHTLQEMGESPDYSEADFIQCFHQFSKNGRGYITKPEMTLFIKKVAGIDVSDEKPAEDISQMDGDD